MSQLLMSVNIFVFHWNINHNHHACIVVSTFRPPAKPIQRSNSCRQDSSTRASSVESLESSTEQQDPIDEPYYDSVALDDLTQSKSIPHNSTPLKHIYAGEKESSSENVFTTSSTLPLPAKRNTGSDHLPEPQSPGTTSNYVNIEYFIK